MNPESGGSNTCKGHCPQCDQKLNASILASESRTEQWEVDGFGRIEEFNTYRILQCRGCETLYVQRAYWISESQGPPRVTHWPSPPSPDWVRKLADGPLRNLLREVYGAVNSGHRVLAAIGARTALDRAMVLNGAGEASTLEDKRKELRDKGVIGQHEFETLFKLVDAGSAAAHRAWVPQLEELTKLIEGMEAFLYRTLVLTSAVNSIDAPPKVPRPKRSRSSPGN